ncbi:hypothetical protein JCM21900_003959 [Sporobolomyces salmonicolor]
MVAPVITKDAPQSSLPISVTATSPGERHNINRALLQRGLPGSPSAPLAPLRSPSSLSPVESRGTPSPSLPLTFGPVSFESLLAIVVAPPPPASLGPTHRRQPLRFETDLFTPAWVKGDGQAKEGWCSLCEAERGAGKWFKLKDGAYWYHRQFQHGISSSTGAPFKEPVDTRCKLNSDDHPLVEGLCGTCHKWTTYETCRPVSFPSPSPSSPSRPPTSGILRTSHTLWFRHAHECHNNAPAAVQSPVRRRVLTRHSSSSSSLLTASRTATPVVTASA